MTVWKGFVEEKNRFVSHCRLWLIWSEFQALDPVSISLKIRLFFPFLLIDILWNLLYAVTDS